MLMRGDKSLVQGVPVRALIVLVASSAVQILADQLDLPETRAGSVSAYQNASGLLSLRCPITVWVKTAFFLQGQVYLDGHT